jgi:hypothetical protein
MTKSKTNEASLSKLLCHYRDTLRVLNIRYIILDGPGWKSIFRKLSQFPLLESFSFGSLREGREVVHFPIASESPVTDKATEFTFRPRKLRERTVNIGVSCRGPCAKATIQKLIESMEVHHFGRPEQPANSA